MAKQPTPAPTTGPDLKLMQSIAKAGFAMLTQDQGAALVAAGLAQVDTSVTDGDTAKVTLTDAGLAMVTPKASSFVVRNDVPMPTGKRRGRRGSIYPIETMNVGESFHIPTTADNPDPAARIASSLSNARIKFSEGTGEQETVKQKVYKRDENGVIEKDAEGHRIVESETEVTREKTKPTREWSVASVDASDPEGPGARVWRTL